METNFTINITLSGHSSGPKSVILAGVHGNETCGIEAIKKLLTDLRIDSGEVIFAFGNPQAIEQGTRFTEENLNRMFLPRQLLTVAQTLSYEFRRAEELKEIFKGSEVLLDIHASNNPSSQPFIICEENAKDIYKYLPIKTVVHGFDIVEPGGTDYYMNSIGKIGICIECGYIKDDESVKIAINSILSFLRARGHILNGDNVEIKKELIEMYYLYKTKTNRFTLSKPFADFENVMKDQMIGIDGMEKIFAPEDSIILFAKDLSIKNSEAFLLGRNMDHKKITSIRKTHI